MSTISDDELEAYRMALAYALASPKTRKAMAEYQAETEWLRTCSAEEYAAYLRKETARRAMERHRGSVGGTWRGLMQ